jgi:tRNA A37 threonylcarbamoyladenosine dehydratase
MADSEEIKGHTNHQAAGSISFVPGVAGLLIAGEVVRDLLAEPKKEKIFSHTPLGDTINRKFEE